ncbi:MAG: hypothetical protein JO303_17030, partial [Caulobacteraceae bacterium]|nr:hypothetical protein [Caulobacteraceae bacterium]
MLSGSSFVGASEARSDRTFTAVDPATGKTLDPAFAEMSPAEVDRACALAHDAFDT